MQKSTHTLQELALLLKAQVKGDPNCIITGIAPLDRAQPGQLSFLTNSQYRQYLATTKASAVLITSQDTEYCPMNALIMNDPYLGYAKAATLFNPTPLPAPGIHSSVIMGKNCRIAPTASIAANCVIGDDVSIGEYTRLNVGTIVGDQSIIGDHCNLAARVTLAHSIRLGHRVIIHSGVVIGSDGFGMAQENGVWVKIPQLGNVIIGNDVEIGANTTIDRGALDDTVIEDGVKLDNLIQIAHNVHIGAHTAIAACTAIAGSSRIGKHCMIGGASSIVGHIEITDRVILVGTSVVEKSITTAGVYGSGTGLMPFRDLKRNIVRYRQLDELARRLNKLEKAQNEHDGN